MNWRIWIASAAALAGGAAAPAAPLLESTVVFRAGADHVHEYRIPGLLATPRGTLLAFCDARVHRSGDPPNEIHLVLKRSDDAGRTWSALQTVATNGRGAVADSCGIVDRQTGTVWIFDVYAPEGVGSANAAPGITGATFSFKAVRSDDDGRTWSAPIDFTSELKRPEWSAGSTGIGAGIQTRSGRLILPRYHGVYQPGRHGAAASASCVAYSDDHGRTWRLGADVPCPAGSDECTVAELDDGSLVFNLRSLTGHHRLISRSRDGGATWSPAVEDPVLIEPRCEGSSAIWTRADSGGRSRLLFANPAALTRSHYTVRLSYDGGRTWAATREIHPGPAAYGCLTVLPDGTAAALYERGEKTPYEEIAFARFNAEWLTAGADSGR